MRVKEDLQDFHVAEAPEGSVHEAGDAVPLHAQRPEPDQTVERQALDASHAVPAQIPVRQSTANQCQ